MSSEAASTYSTGGGGVTLEHQYVATLLASLVSGAPASELGDSIAITTVRLQASAISAVDDVLLEGTDATGVCHRSSVGVRRDPKLTTSDTKSVPLVRAFLCVVTQQWNDISAGRWSLTLAVAKSRPATSEVNELSSLARSTPNTAAFLESVARPGVVNAPVRKRLVHLRALVAEASGQDEHLSTFNVDELLWRWLSHLKVRILRLEGSDTTDRTHAVNTLQTLGVDGTPAAADALFSRLVELAGAYASSGAAVTGGMLRRELGDHPIKRLSLRGAGWRAFDRLEQQARDQTRNYVNVSGRHVHIDRSDAAGDLRSAITAAATESGCLVVTGDPDVGKSALTFRAADELRASGAVMIALSLRDLPDTVSDLELLLGRTGLDDLLDSAATGSARVFVLDGCEAALEGKERIFTAISVAAMRSGFTLVAVTRLDGAAFVAEQIKRALETVRPAPMAAQEQRSSSEVQASIRQTKPNTHEVGHLTSEEATFLAGSIEQLAMLHSDPRSSWLLGRPGLVDALLRSGGTMEPGQLLCEADVYEAVWNGLVRRGGTNPAGTASPDDRASTAVAIAEASLLSARRTSTNGQAIRELRSDGVLRTESNAALSLGPEFSTDLYRDFALCRLFLEHGVAVMASSNMPRWPLRALRLVSQVRLKHAGDDIRAAWDSLLREFGELASLDGARWLEIPYEALLTLGDASRALEELWEPLTAGDGLSALLRLADARYAQGSVGDPHALAPIVEVAFCQKGMLGHYHRSSHRTPDEYVSHLVLAWLRALPSESPHPLRQRTRNSILERDVSLGNSFAVEALGTLGVDLNDEAKARLRQVAIEQPSSLHPVVESPFAVNSIVEHHATFLLELSEAYYIEQPRRRSMWGGRSPMEDGIRDFQHGALFGFGPPQAAWYFGPFWQLLRVAPRDTTAFINRMLNHAALHRVSDGAARSDDPDLDRDTYQGVTLRLTDASDSRHYVGDSHVWAWYRGSSVGPYACMSALLALERYADQLLERADIAAASIVDFMLIGCRNLAVPGMLGGFLTRHLERADGLIDPYLASAAVWHLETGRVTGEHFSVRDRDADKLTGNARRAWTPHEVVGHLVVNARAQGDTSRQAELEKVGERLEASVRAEIEEFRQKANVEDLDDKSAAALKRELDEQLAVGRTWAAEFDFANYRVTQTNDGAIISFERPDELEEALAESTARLSATNELYRLQAAYALKNETPEEWPLDHLREDINVARALMEKRQTDGFGYPENALIALASAAIYGYALGLAVLEEDDLEWAALGVVQTAVNVQVDGFAGHTSMFAMGADRAAAVALPLLLLAPCEGVIDPLVLSHALKSIASSPFDEVRWAFAKGCRRVWTAPCSGDGKDDCSRHGPLWSAVEEGLSQCVLGPWDNELQLTTTLSLRRPYAQSLRQVSDKDILVHRLRMPLMCASDAAPASCLASALPDLLAALWDAYRRGLNESWQHFDHLDAMHHAPIARLMIEAAIRGEREYLDQHLHSVAGNPHGLQMFMDGFAEVFTYDDVLRESLGQFWEPSLRVVLDAIDGGADLRADRDSWFDWAVASLLPTPHLDTSDRDPDATLERCQASWVHPDAFVELFPRWAELAKGEARAAESLARLLRGAPLEWQATTGLEWMLGLVGEHHAALANRVWSVTRWLRNLRESQLVEGASTARFNRLVDGLASGGDDDAVALQQLAEERP